LAKKAFFIQREGKRMGKAKEVFITNIWQAAYLLYSGENLAKTILEGTRVAFVFNDSASLQKKISVFLSGTVEANVSKYISFYQYLKNLIYMEKGKLENEKAKRKNERRFRPRAVCDDRE